MIMFFVFAIISTSPAYGHKLISHDDTHRDFDSALQIPDHKISWAIYENLEVYAIGLRSPFGLDLDGSTETVRGRQLFDSLGCANCHGLLDFLGDDRRAPMLSHAGLLDADYIRDSIGSPFSGVHDAS